MAALLDWDWLFFAAGGLLGVAALWLLWRGLWADRSRGRARCPRCWYDLGALLPLPLGEGRGEGSLRGAFASVTCPECGRVVRRERQMWRTRRRWWVVMGGVVFVLLAFGVALTPNVRRDGAWSITPTWAMVLLDVTVGRESWKSLDEAMRERLFEPGQSSWATARLALSDRANFRFRSIWPREVPLLIGGKLWSRPPTAGGPRELQIWMEDGDARRMVAFDPDALIFSHVSLPRLSYETVWRDSVTQFGDTTAAPPVSLCVGRLTNDWKTQRFASFRVPIRFVDSLNKAITPVDDPSLATLIKEKLHLRLSSLPTTGRLCLSARDIDDEALRGVTLGLHVELFDDAGRIATAKWWQRDGAGRSMGGLPVYLQSGRGDLAAELAKLSPSVVYVRVRGDGEMALRDFDGTRYWAGEFTMPLSELIRPAATTPAGDQTP